MGVAASEGRAKVARSVDESIASILDLGIGLICLDADLLISPEPNPGCD